MFIKYIFFNSFLIDLMVINLKYIYIEIIKIIYKIFNNFRFPFKFKNTFNYEYCLTKIEIRI